jgi:hypothetical protein
MNINKIAIDGIIGGLMFALFSYFTSIFDNDPKYLKISAFVWGVPMFYFYLVYITWSQSKLAMIEFTKHAVLGTALTVVVMIVTLYITNMSATNVIIINIAMLILFLLIYFYFEIYKL